MSLYSALLDNRLLITHLKFQVRYFVESTSLHALNFVCAFRPVPNKSMCAFRHVPNKLHLITSNLHDPLLTICKLVLCQTMSNALDHPKKIYSFLKLFDRNHLDYNISRIFWSTKFFHICITFSDIPDEMYFFVDVFSLLMIYIVLYSMNFESHTISPQCLAWIQALPLSTLTTFLLWQVQ